MKDYLNQLLQLFRKHYAEHRYAYISLMLGIFGFPLLMAFWTKTAVTPATMYVAMWLIAIVVTLHISTSWLRNRYTSILANTLPVSVGVRYGFILINSIVTSALLFFVCYLPSLAITKVLFPPAPEFNWVFSDIIFLSNYHTYFGILGTHAMLLIVNLIGGRRIFITYLVAILIAIVVQIAIGRYIGVEYRESYKLVGNILLIFVAWIGGYFILRNYQIRS